MSFELVLFILVAAVAIFSAALMLVSRNAVHSALFLVINLLCVAFFYLMLSAPFLAMVQITVYAGAIMVLFMFVIMLLGSQKLGGGTPRYPWLVPGAVALTTIFLVVAFISIVRGNIGLLKPIPNDPQVRFVNAVAGGPAVDLYLNDRRIVVGLEYRHASELEGIHAGDYNLLAFPACVEADPSKCINPLKSSAPPLVAVPLTLQAEAVTTYIIGGTLSDLKLITVPTDLSTTPDDASWRLTAVNALPGSGQINLTLENPNDPKKSDVVSAALAYGDVSKDTLFQKGNYTFAWEQGGARLASLQDFVAQGKHQVLIILLPETTLTVNGTEATRPTVYEVEPVRTRESFGSPQMMGTELFSTYLLPLELVALLLLGSMVGAIILTREEVVKRERKRLIVSPAIKRINRAINTNTAVASSTSAEAVSNPKAAKSSAD